MTDNQFHYTLSNDSTTRGEDKDIFLSTQSNIREVRDFLKELKSIIEKADFNIDTDILLIRKNKQGDNQKYSTPYTLLDLDYDVQDIVDRLKELRIEEYSETKFDKDDLNPPLLFVFGKMINDRLVYIKLKIKRNQYSYILCVSFHYAKDEMIFPYA